MTDVESQIAGYFAKYAPAISGIGKALRAKLRARLPGLFEIVYVYERQQALVISYSPTERGYEGLCSLALRPDVVQLHFAQGASLSMADPGKLLQGHGKTVRHVVLESAADFDRPAIQALLTAACTLAKLRPSPDAGNAVISRVESQRTRSRRQEKKKRKKKKKPTATASPARKKKGES